MCVREEAYQLRGKVQIIALGVREAVDAYLGGERNDGKTGRGSEKKIPIVAAVSNDDAWHPVHVKRATVRTFCFAATADWPHHALAKGCEVISDGMACFFAVVEVGCVHQPVVVRGRHHNELPEFRWITTMLSNLKISSPARSMPYELISTRIAIWWPSATVLIGDSICRDDCTVLHAACLCTAQPAEHLLRRAEHAT